MAQSYSCLQHLLQSRSDSESCGYLSFYPLGNTSTPRQVSYKNLYTIAKKNSFLIRSLKAFRENEPILLHLEDHWENVLWFWSILLANGLPVLSSPLSNIDDQRQEHLQGLSSLLKSPICITSTDYLPLFDGLHTFEMHVIETLAETNLGDNTLSGKNSQETKPGRQGLEPVYMGGKTPAFLMLTSGSTGHAKAVSLTHHQVFASIKGKASARQLPQGRPFMNWVGLDHVASLVEIHLQALWLGVGQIHVHAADIVPSPGRFLDLLSEHRVARSFAPNFFLAKLVQAAGSMREPGLWDLSDLAFLASGGEANDLETCVAASALLVRYGAVGNVVAPGFGMTETCAGAIHNLQSPAYDAKNGFSVCCLGKCIQGIDMRVVVACSETASRMASTDEVGDLEVCGDIVFDQYYRNPEETRRAFTSDGWFRTGDRAKIDSGGNLHLCGRVKDVINLNGVKIPCARIQLALEQTLGARVSRVLSFPSRATHTEQITVAIIPHQWPMSAEERTEISEMAVRACFICSGHRPVVFCLEEKSLSLLPTTTLGKISRAKMGALFDAGHFARDLDLHRAAVSNFRKERKYISENLSEEEAMLIEDVAQTLRISAQPISVDSTIFDLGCSSMDLVRLKRRVDARLNVSIPIVIFMKHPTTRSLAAAIGAHLRRNPGRLDLPPAVAYDPVVTLRAQGTKTPLWLVHPGVGEILVFLGLSQHLSSDDRPVYALRARGFEPGQTRFSSIAEAVEVYVRAIRSQQPRGPYAIAGYSYGTMLAFEIAKALESEGNPVRFLGSFNLPPHIKTRMRHLNWNMCLLHLSYFLDLTTEEYAQVSEEKGFQSLHRNEASKQVLRVADASRMAELGLSETELSRWTDVAFGLQVSANRGDEEFHYENHANRHHTEHGCRLRA